MRVKRTLSACRDDQKFSESSALRYVAHKLVRVVGRACLLRWAFERDGRYERVGVVSGDRHGTALTRHHGAASMSLKKKIASFVERHGYSARAFFVSVLAFPPAALFIAFKHPTWSLPQRCLALLGMVAFHVSIPFVIGRVVTYVFG